MFLFLRTSYCSSVLGSSSGLVFIHLHLKKKNKCGKLWISDCVPLWQHTAYSTPQMCVCLCVRVCDAPADKVVQFLLLLFSNWTRASNSSIQFVTHCTTVPDSSPPQQWVRVCVCVCEMVWSWNGETSEGRRIKEGNKRTHADAELISITNMQMPRPLWNANERLQSSN